MENNPLQLLQKEQNRLMANVSKTNMRGRPKLEKTILFSPQPKSIVADLLAKKKIVPYDTKVSLTPSTPSKGPALDPDEYKPKLQDMYTCGDCSYTSENKQIYKRHITIHKQFTCGFQGCNYACKLLSNLVKHKRVHTDEKPYLCDRCSFRTNFINSLKSHSRTHTTERPYHCQHCDYKCNSSSNLKKHCLQKHLSFPLNASDNGN